MILNDHLRAKFLSVLDGEWKIGFYSRDGRLLGESEAFIYPPKLNIQIAIVETGTVKYALLVQGEPKIGEKIRQYSALIKRMSGAGSKTKEILTAIAQAEDHQIEMTLTVGEHGADLNMSSCHLISGNTITIDSLRLGFGI